MKFGIKLWSINHELYEEAVDLIKRGKADYLELLYVPGAKDKLEFLKQNKIPVIIHAPTYHHRVCFSDNNFEKNDKMFKETVKIADYLNAEKIIIHPGKGNGENFARFLRQHQDNRIIIENMPKVALDGALCTGYSPSQIRGFLLLGPFSFCLDFSHAIKASLSLKLDYKEYLKKFMKIKALMFHISDGRLSIETDQHLSLGEGNFDLSFIKKLIKENEAATHKSKNLTFEVPKGQGLKNDIKNIELFKAIK